jgi:hypothetical protein
VALANITRLSLKKGAHAVLSGAAWQEIRVRSGRDDNSFLGLLSVFQEKYESDLATKIVISTGA